MKRMTFDEIYAANETAQKQLLAVVGGIGAEAASRILPGEGWSIAEVVEHVSLVEGGICRIVTRLLEKAREENRPSAVFATISASFTDGMRAIANEKREAPEIVTPQGKSLDESLASLAETSARLIELRPMFDKFDSESFKFPHPFFGDMSAAEWLVLAGGHKSRHIRQIQRLLDPAD